jgi:UDP-N-acetylglucosamine acyltransferase
MSTGHIGHNCTVGNHVIIANSGLVGGHITIGDRAFVSGCAVIHQFVRIGELAMIGGGCRVTKDVPPFMIVGPQGPFNVNVVGLRRAGYTSEERLELRECFRILYREETFFPRAIERVAEKVRTAPGRRLVEFLQAPSKRGYLRKRRAGDGAREEVDDLT